MSNGRTIRMIRLVQPPASGGVEASSYDNLANKVIEANPHTYTALGRTLLRLKAGLENLTPQLRGDGQWRRLSEIPIMNTMWNWLTEVSDCILQLNLRGNYARRVWGLGPVWLRYAPVCAFAGEYAPGIRGERK